MCSELCRIELIKAGTPGGSILGSRFLSFCGTPGSPARVLGFSVSCCFWRIQLHYFVAGREGQQHPGWVWTPLYANSFSLGMQETPVHSDPHFIYDASHS